MEKINLAIVEDNPGNLKSTLAKVTDFNVLFTAFNGKSAYDQLKNSATLPDVILMDIEMPVMNGIEATDLIKREFPQIKVLALTVFDDDDRILKMILSGASGYLLKDSSAEMLSDAVNQLAQGGAPMSPVIAYKIIRLLKESVKPPAQDPKLDLLTVREREILEMIKEGQQNKEIADRLFISPFTVRKHIENVYSKLHVKNRVEAIRLLP